MSFFKVPGAKKAWTPDPAKNPVNLTVPVVYAGTAIYAHSKGQMTQAQLDSEIHVAITNFVTEYCYAQGIELDEDNHGEVFKAIEDDLQAIKTNLTTQAFEKYGEQNAA